MLRIIAISAALLSVIGSGVLHGYWTNRWTTSPELEMAVARLERVPLAIGEWQGQPVEVNADQIAQAEIAGYVARRFENRTGQIVNLFLVCGRSGPIAVHPPEVCYTGAGFKVIGEAQKCRITPATPTKPAEFFRARFEKPASAGTGHLNLYYAWNAAGSWEAPSSPRRSFASYRALYKMYVSREVASGDAKDGEVCAEFLKQTLPALEKALFSD